MRKNGFTLIELLAVIVILAIIALIATPIILGIINDARKESQERSIELYASAVRNGIAAYQLREMKEVAAGSYTSETLPFDVEYDGDVECTTIELYEDGGVYVGGCTVNGLEVDYTYGTQQEKAVKLSEVCIPSSEQLYATNAIDSGYKYECDVDPSKEGYDYSFYVLNNDGNTVNLLMSENLVDSTPWISFEHYTAAGGTRWGMYTDQSLYGPITALKALKENTIGWENLGEYSYELTYGPVIVEAEMKDYNIPYTGEYVQNVRTRLPKLSEVQPFENKTWLYDGLNNLGGIYGYWLSDGTNNPGYSSFAWHVYHQVASNGQEVFEVSYMTSSLTVSESNLLGIRPVINLSI